PQALIDRVLAQIVAHIARFDNPATAYQVVPREKWRPRYSDYTHLERLDEGEIE
ncbi:MAG: hypothetical protein JO258_00270, partial [Alphaproteobacteria bacterium]|nr:hypothetical protein [Alphaproteobacteria bacterium]